MRVVKATRPRRAVHPLLLELLRPLFRYSQSREAYVVRIGSGRRGPVKISKTAEGRHRPA